MRQKIKAGKLCLEYQRERDHMKEMDVK